MTCTIRQVGGDNSNIFFFVLIERGTQIIRQIRTIRIPDDYRRKLVRTWSTVTQPFDVDQAMNVLSKMTDKQILDEADVWVYNPETEEFDFEVKLH